MAEFKVIETQEQLDAIVGDRVARAKDSARKEFEGWISPDELTKQTADLNTKVSGLTDQIKALSDEKAALQTQLTEKDGKIAKYETDSAKTKIARELGLSYEAIDFIQGDSEEAIRKSAESLKALVGIKFTPPQFNPNQGKGDGDTTLDAYRKMSRELRGED